MTASAAITDEAAARAAAKRRAQKRAAFLRQVLRWHWISAAICLIGMMLFAVTGITLNHAGAIGATPKVTERTAEAPADLLPLLQAAEAEGGPTPEAVRAWLRKELKVAVPADAAPEWSPGELYLALPRPGGDAWLSLDTATGEVIYERTDRGAIAYLNDLHKGRNTGAAWMWFIDIFAVGCVVFCITGLLLLQLHAHARKSTWPLVGLGLIIPLLLALLFIH
ncbi:MAG: PepSY-associated TM helix domain-containing protein [Phenylobacterium sp.]|uniref:PepSY-associated TM helix domain-containing protein n=2 Tax=Phenylobacterium sp. TaxID=1871053 RepID=UPI0017FCC998|nr:PepSY-associated TM helix domain-containing protein [Phenylobacterium sp.]MBA4794123.1 PepSY-associated TM helix domain-containing protein [Phenylobacterium sp.]